MDHKIQKVAVLGAGTMGAQIAGHFSNAGIPSILFDINSDLAKNGVEILTKLRPAPLYKPKNAERNTACTYDDDLEKWPPLISKKHTRPVLYQVRFCISTYHLCCLFLPCEGSPEARKNTQNDNRSNTREKTQTKSYCLY